MQEKKVYEYAFIRVVPCVEREEFLNLGVILFCKSNRYLEMLYQIDRERLSIFSKELDLDELADYLKAWELICKGDNKNGGKIAQLDHAGRFRWITATKSTILQCSKVHPGLSADPEGVIEGLFERYVK